MGRWFYPGTKIRSEIQLRQTNAKLNSFKIQKQKRRRSVSIDLPAMHVLLPCWKDERRFLTLFLCQDEFPFQYDNLRSISILSGLSNLLEYSLKAQISEHLARNNILRDRVRFYEWLQLCHNSVKCYGSYYIFRDII